MSKNNQDNLITQDVDIKTTDHNDNQFYNDAEKQPVNQSNKQIDNQLGNQEQIDNRLNNQEQISNQPDQEEIDNRLDSQIEKQTDNQIDNHLTSFEKNTVKPKKKNKKAGKINSVINWLLLVCITILAGIIVFLNVFTLCPVSGGSMLPNIVDTQRVLLVRTSNAKNGDIVVFQRANLGTNGKNLIKRVIASGGDRLLFVASSDKPTGLDNRTVYLYRDSGDGFMLLDESKYILEDMRYSKTPQSDFCKIYECANPALLFVNGEINNELSGETLSGIGDIKSSTDIIINNTTNNQARNISNNLVDNDNLQDTPSDNYEDYIITIPQQHYYAMGDNRNVSNDSRDYTIGFVHKDDLIGREVIMLKQDSFLEKILMFFYRDNGADRESTKNLLLD